MTEESMINGVKTATWHDNFWLFSGNRGGGDETFADHIT
ncbi:hypothetical protein SACS_1185 [Parasaccharibacter apium]|uniref:Uncharacterized protein n=1 Tax=Parasaccharibacter apium TaxID=1510841 RepID=A0A7U7G6C6_9PROT|nr:hypothetical protein SACS_1185 [Parasaccharibacter apium]